jgi:outer membrane biosynthesis protein TonB
MAKKQTFESKLSKKGSNFKYVKHIKSVVSEDSGFIKFLDNMVRLEENENIDQALKRMEEESKQVLSFGESIEEAPAEEVKEEAPVEESKEEAPTEEVKEEAPVEESEPATEDQSAEEADVSSDK